MADVMKQAKEAIKAVAQGLVGAPFGEVFTYDRSRYDKPPGMTMGRGVSQIIDDIGIRAVAHRRKWRHIIKGRTYFRFDPANADRDTEAIDGLIALLVDAFEADPTMGGLVEASSVRKVGEPAYLTNQQGVPVMQIIDVEFAVDAFSPWDR